MLVSSQTLVKGGHGFGDHTKDGELAQWGLGRDTFFSFSCVLIADQEAVS